MPLVEKLDTPLVSVVTHRLQIGSDRRLRRFLFDAQARARLCSQLEVLAASSGSSAALDIEPASDDRQSPAFTERSDWIETHWDEVERLALFILNGMPT